MLSQKAKYALRAALLLAQCESSLTAREISKRECISVKFLEAVLVELRDHKIVTSTLGRHGGYRLTRSPSEVSFGAIIRAIDGPLAPIRCASRTQFQPCADCVDIDTCAIRWAMSQARDAIARVLDGCTLTDALRRKGRSDRLRDRRPDAQSVASVKKRRSKNPRRCGKR